MVLVFITEYIPSLCVTDSGILQHQSCVLYACNGEQASPAKINNQV